MNEQDMRKLDRAASRPRGPRSRAENLQRYREEPATIARSPTRCAGCGQEQGKPHLVGCRYAALV